MKHLLLATLFFLLSSLLLLGFMLAFLSLPTGQRSEPVEVRVEQGEPFSTVAWKLRDGSVISNARLLSLWARLWGLDKKIHWGIYRFGPSLSPREILDRMVLGKGLFRRVTIPEGLTVRAIADLMEKAGIANKERFLKEARSPELLSVAGLEDKGIEGYLFPETYYFTPFATERDILVAITQRFQQVFKPKMEEQGKKIGLNLHEVVILASLIEKEAAVEAERPLVSAVFHNRLRDKIPLQSDPTVIYGLKRFSGSLLRKDLQSPSPYNTYRIRGLPPGPICNPGLSSLMAALYPAPVPYLYFVSKNDGSHFFSVRLEEHNRAVKIYQGAVKQIRRQ